MLPRLRAEIAGAGVATQPPGGAGVCNGSVLARESVEGGVARPLSEEVDELKSGGGGTELEPSVGSLMNCRVGAGVASQAPGGRGVFMAVRLPARMF